MTLKLPHVSDNHNVLYLCFGGYLCESSYIVRVHYYYKCRVATPTVKVSQLTEINYLICSYLAKYTMP